MAKEKKVKVYRPRVRGVLEDDKIVVLNGTAYSIPRGKEWEVPAGVAELLDHCGEAERFADEFASETNEKAIEKDKYLS